MRKTGVYLLLLLGCMYVPATAQELKDIALKTEVSEATVFIKGAQIVRKTTANLPAGRSTVRFVNLSPYIDAKSIRVKVDGAVMVLSVDRQLNYNDTLKLSGDIEKLRQQRQELNDKIRLENIAKDALHKELAFLADNSKIGGNNGIDFNTLKTTSTYYGERAQVLLTKEMEIDKRIRSLSSEMTAIDRKLDFSGSVKPEPTGEIMLHVDCKTAVHVPVECSYYVNNAGWYPSYDIRVKSISEPVEIAYKANIMQNTKEIWRNVRLKVSSANPNLGNVAPKLKTYLLDYHTPPPRYDTDNLFNQVSGRITDTSGEALPGASVSIQGSTIGTIADVDGRYSLALPAGGGNLVVSYIGYKQKIMPVSASNMDILLEEDEMVLDEVVVVAFGKQKMDDAVVSAEPAPRKASTRGAEKSLPVPVMQLENTTSVEFDIKTPYTIPSENKSMTIEMERYSIPAEYEYYAVPKVNRDAFLLANISGWEQYSLLEGEANIFFENTFVGKTILDVRATGDTLNLSLGRDKSVSVLREKVKEYSTQKFLGSKVETSRDWKITVRNNKRQPVEMLVFDQIPVSTLQEIEVDADIADGTLNRETGEVKWKFTLQPAQKKELRLKYRVKYPKGKSLPVE
ncbi:MAG: mucoidy inhibitor MuiA family protein [Tannerella sp.]|jgi:hypothetical protein|nr:mucoidy inhibitor MuiA family protein [Tannerella sp.]